MSEQKRNAIIKDVYCILFLIAVVFVFFQNPLFSGRIFFHDDLGDLNIPLKKMMLDHGINNGALLWNPYQFSGQPYLADFSTALYYPPNWIFYFLTPGRGIVYYVVIHFILAALFTFLLLRSLNLGRFASTAGAAVFTFSGPMVLRIVHLNILSAIALLPLVFLAAVFFCRHKNAAAAAALALVFALHIFAGVYQHTQYMFIMTGIFILVHLNYKKIKSRKNVRLVVLFILAVILSLGVTACATVPGYEFISRSLRVGGLSYRQAAEVSMGLRELVVTFMPDYYGDTQKWANAWHLWERCSYLGVFPLMMILYAITAYGIKSDKKIFSFALIGLLGVLLALGKNFPLYWLFYHLVPFFKSQRIPMRYLVGAVFAGSIITAYAADRLMKTAQGKRFLKESKIVAGRRALMSVFILFAALLIYRLPMDYRGTVFFAIVGAATYAIIHLAIRKKASARLLGYGFVILALLSGFSFWFNATPTLDQAHFQKKAAIFTRFGNQTPAARVYSNPPLFIKEYLNLPAYHDVSNIIGYNPLNLERYMEYIVWNELGVPVDGALRTELINRGGVIAITRLKTKMIRLLNLKAIYAYPRKKGIPGAAVTKVENSYPRAFYVKNHRVIKDKITILKRLNSADFNPRREIILEEDPEKTGTEDKTTASLINLPRITRYEPDYIRIKVDPPYKSFLFLSEVYYPGWKATVDGEDRKIYRANYVFRAIPVKPGDRCVEVIFKPQSVKTGRIVSIISILITMAMAATGLKKSNKTKPVK